MLAFTDSDLGAWTSARRRLQTVTLGTVYAICERRAAVPELSDDELRAQHQAVIEISRRSRATLPVRFGALIDERELVEWTRDHEAELRRGLNEVRDRVQMTIRVLGRPAAASQRPVAITSGRAYLEARRRALEPELPPAVRDVLDKLRPLVARERVEAGQGGLLATVYHLISKRNLPAYRRAVEGAPAETIVSGPWPPFAFAPPLW